MQPTIAYGPDGHPLAESASNTHVRSATQLENDRNLLSKVHHPL